MKQPKKDTLTPRLRELHRKANSFFKQQLPKIIHREGLQFIADNFDKEAFREKKGSISKWQQRKPVKKDTRPGRQLLVDKGHLRRSWELDSTYQNNRIVFGSALPYAEPHNDGGRAGRGRGFTMPQRQMIGPSEVMAEMIENKLTREMNRIIE